MTKKENPGFLSLNQGQNFNNKQVSNINKQNQHKVQNVQNDKKVQKEGFTTNTDITSTNYKPVLINEYTRMNSTKAQNQSDLSELQSLQSQYTDLLSKYSDLTNQIKGVTQENIDRVSPNNPYLSKNATLNNSKGELPVISSGTGGYVTSQGMFKSYPDDNTYSITAGKNGCPTDFIQNVELDKYSKTFIQGKDMISGQSCGNEGSNVYVSKLNDNPIGTYIGCYNNKPEPVKTNIVPKMGTSNKSNGFISSASSIYQNNNNTFGPWAAFDENINTFWHSEYPRYSNGQYTGSNNLSVVLSNGTTSVIKGELLQISMPGINTSTSTSIILTSYEIQGRQDCCGNSPMTANGRNPHSWYIVGYNNSDKKWYFVDYQITTDYNISLQSFSISGDNQKPYSAYAIIIDSVGDNSAPSSQKTCVQISQWNLYTSSTENANGTSTEAMIDSKLGFTTPDKCKSYALDNNYKFYAMQAKQSNGTSTCLVSNDKTQVISYGQSKNPITMIPLWSSNTPNTNYVSASISQTGQLTLTDANGNTKTLNDAVTQCNGSPCSFYLLLQKDGNMCLYNGKPGDRSTVIFSTKTAGSQKNLNNDWVASKGEYGNAYLNLGQTLSTNQWIGSDDGALKLIMQSDGNLVLYTSSVKNGCSVSNGNNYGNANINAVYQIDSTGFPNNLGNIGYVDKDAVLHPYPSTMIGYSSTYNVYDNFDSQGNDISQTQTNDINGCEQACNANDQCAGFVFEKGSNICYLKNSGMYPKSPRQPNTKLTMAVRKPTIINSDSKPNSIPMPIEIDSIRYENYQKGDNMTTTTKYNEPVINENIKNQMTLIQNKLTSVASHIADKMEAMYTQDKQILSKMNMNDEEFKQKILMYKRVSMDQNNLNGIRSKTDTNNKKEGMQNLNINDINGMLMDSDTHILQENYGYIFWSILAVGLLTVTINVMKKDM